jgi:hypothetical protein
MDKVNNKKFKIITVDDNHFVNQSVQKNNR